MPHLLLLVWIMNRGWWDRLRLTRGNGVLQLVEFKFQPHEVILQVFNETAALPVPEIALQAVDVLLELRIRGALRLQLLHLRLQPFDFRFGMAVRFPVCLQRLRVLLRGLQLGAKGGGGVGQILHSHVLQVVAKRMELIN